MLDRARYLMDWSYKLEEVADCPNGWCISICGVAAIPVVQTDGKHFCDERPDVPVSAVLCWDLHAFLPPTLAADYRGSSQLRNDEFRSEIQSTRNLAQNGGKNPALRTSCELPSHR